MVHFRDRAKGRAARVCDSLLRADRHPGAGVSRERPAALRRYRALPAGGGAEAQQAGFSLDEIRRLFFGFSHSTPISQRWKRIAERKMVELDARIEQIQSMRTLLKKLEACCECETVERCGRYLAAEPR